MRRDSGWFRVSDGAQRFDSLHRRVVGGDGLVAVDFANGGFDRGLGRDDERVAGRSGGRRAGLIIGVNVLGHQHGLDGIGRVAFQDGLDALGVAHQSLGFLSGLFLEPVRAPTGWGERHGVACGVHGRDGFAHQPEKEQGEEKHDDDGCDGAAAFEFDVHFVNQAAAKNVVEEGDNILDHLLFGC